MSGPDKENQLLSLVEDHSGRISHRSERLKKTGQGCCPSRLTTWRKLRAQEKALQGLPQTSANLALDGGSHQKGEHSQSCEDCWDLPCSYQV